MFKSKNKDRSTSELAKALKADNRKTRIYLAIVVLFIVVAIGGVITISFYSKRAEDDNSGIIEAVAEDLSAAADIVDSKVKDAVEGSEGTVEVVDTRIRLSDIISISALSTLKYEYDAVCHAYNPGTNIIVYDMKYSGDVYIGINPEEIEEEIDDENKTVTIYLPPVEIQRCEIVGEIEVIFQDEAYNNEDAFSNSHRLCEQDLYSRVSNDANVLDAAMNNCYTEVQALTEPLVNTLYPDYELIIVWK